MNCLDFLSESPKMFIFKEERYKSNFGGVLFFIYIMVMTLISSVYIVNYAINDKYIISALTYYNQTRDEDINSLTNDEKLNPYVNFNITIRNIGENDIIIYDVEENQYVEPYKKTKGIQKDVIAYFNLGRKRVTGLMFDIIVKCGKDEECKNVEYDGNSIVVTVHYTGYILNHYEEIPLQISEDNPNKFSFEIGFIDTFYESLDYFWEVVKYQDEKSLFDTLMQNEKEYTFGYIKNTKTRLDPQYTKKGYINYNPDLHMYIMPLISVFPHNEHDEYIVYKRVKIEFLDVLADIGALFSTIKFCFSFIFSFYSQNFNNYKIIWKFLNYVNEDNKKIDLNIEDNEISEPKFKENISEIDNQPLIDEASSENKLSINDLNNDQEKEEKIDKEISSIKLKKISFFSFFFNNIYCKSCRKIKNQEILNATNEITSKYLSVDYLLYNQIKLENLFKDYKWNNPLLNTFRNNQLLMNLNNG